MNTITTYVYGDLHIHVTPASTCKLMKSLERPCMDYAFSEDITESGGYQALVSSLEDYLHDAAEEYGEFDNGAADQDIDSIVMVLYPGQPPKIMTESECYDAVERHGSFCSALTMDAPDICAYGLKAAYDPRTVLPVGSESYLIGPVIIYASDENSDSISLDAEEVMAAIVYFTGHTVTLCADGADLPAFRL